MISIKWVKRGRVEPEQDLSGEPPIPSADETLTTPEIPAAPIRCDSVKFDFNSDLGVKAYVQ